MPSDDDQRSPRLSYPMKKSISIALFLVVRHIFGVWGDIKFTGCVGKRVFRRTSLWCIGGGTKVMDDLFSMVKNEQAGGAGGI